MYLARGDALPKSAEKGGCVSVGSTWDGEDRSAGEREQPAGIEEEETANKL